MKKGLSLFILLMLCIFPSMVSAHTTLVSSNPSEGQVISEPIKQITLEFESTLEKLSTLKLIQNGKEIATKGITVENNQMIADLPVDLENGNYEIQWKIVGEDGHPITGEIEFKVLLKQSENKIDSNDKTPEKSIQDNTKNSDVEKENTPKKEKPKLPFVFIAIGIFGILLMVGGVMVWNKK